MGKKSDGEPDGTAGCIVLIIFLAVSPIIWLVALISGSEIEAAFRWPAAIGAVVTTALVVFVSRMAVEPGQKRRWSKLSLPAGVQRHPRPIAMLWSGSPRPDAALDGRNLLHGHVVEVRGRKVYGFVGLSESGEEDWFELCELPYMLPDLDIGAHPRESAITLAGARGDVGDGYADDIGTPALRAAIAGEKTTLRIRGRFVVQRRPKAPPKQYIEHLMGDAPRLAAIVEAIGKDVYLRWSPDARRAVLGDGVPQWEVWDPATHSGVEDAAGHDRERGFDPDGDAS